MGRLSGAEWASSCAGGAQECRGQAEAFAGDGDGDGTVEVAIGGAAGIAGVAMAVG